MFAVNKVQGAAGQETTMDADADLSGAPETFLQNKIKRFERSPEEKAVVPNVPPPISPTAIAVLENAWEGPSPKDSGWTKWARWGPSTPPKPGQMAPKP